VTSNGFRGSTITLAAAGGVAPAKPPSASLFAHHMATVDAGAGLAMVHAWHEAPPMLSAPHARMA